MTGRNHTSKRDGHASPRPRPASRTPTATSRSRTRNIAEVLGERGWNTYMRRQVASVRRRRDEHGVVEAAVAARAWASSATTASSGARRTSGTPTSIHDNHPVAPPASPEEGYHLTDDITDKAIEFVKDAKAIAPGQAVLPVLLPGRGPRAPSRCRRSGSDRYKGVFDMGYEAYREVVFERQKEMGLLPDGAELSPINPLRRTPRATTASRGPSSTWCGRGTRCPTDEKQLFCRMAEVYAGFLSHADHHLGRLLDYLEDSGQLDNTIVVLVSDNGASGEGGPNGSVNENKFFNGIPDTIEENLQAASTSWAAPSDLQPLPDRVGVGVQHALQDVEALRELRGRHRRPVDRLLAGTASRTTGEFRRQYTHAIDIVPDAARMPGRRDARRGQGIHPEPRRRRSASAKRSRTPTRRPTKETQFYSMLGTRAIWHKGWKAVTAVAGSAPIVGRLPPPAHGSCTTPTTDPSECHDLGRPSSPRSLQELDRAVVDGGRRAHGALPLESPERASRSWRRRAAAAHQATRPNTSTTRAGPRYRSPWPRTSVTVRTRIAAEVDIDRTRA